MDRSGDTNVTLTAEEQLLFDRLRSLFEAERLRMARALATGALFGAKEFELRDQVNDLGTHALEVADDERKERGGYYGASFLCPNCQDDAKFVILRDKWCTTCVRSA